MHHSKRTTRSNQTTLHTNVKQNTFVRIDRTDHIEATTECSRAKIHSRDPHPICLKLKNSIKFESNRYKLANQTCFPRSMLHDTPQTKCWWIWNKRVLEGSLSWTGEVEWSSSWTGVLKGVLVEQESLMTLLFVFTIHVYGTNYNQTYAHSKNHKDPNSVSEIHCFSISNNFDIICVSSYKHSECGCTYGHDQRVFLQL